MSELNFGSVVDSAVTRGTKDKQQNIATTPEDEAAELHGEGRSSCAEKPPAAGDLPSTGDNETTSRLIMTGGFEDHATSIRTIAVGITKPPDVGGHRDHKHTQPGRSFEGFFFKQPQLLELIYVVRKKLFCVLVRTEIPWATCAYREGGVENLRFFVRGLGEVVCWSSARPHDEVVWSCRGHGGEEEDGNGFRPQGFYHIVFMFTTYREGSIAARETGEDGAGKRIPE